MVHNSKIKRISLAVCLAFMPFAAHALGLGKLTVLSGLGEPLNAEIELLAPTKEELSTLAARIAPADAYAAQGIDRPAVLGLIKVEVVGDPSGSSVIKLSTPHPVNDPFLDMLIQVEWSTSRLLREYTALLDPPSYDEPKPAQPAIVRPVMSDQPATRPAAEAAGKGKQGKIRKHAAEPAPAEEKPAKEPSAQSDGAGGESAAGPEAAMGGDSYKVHRGDTLHAIARRVQVEGVSLEQMIAGLYRGNKEAFSGDNMNRLQVGKILKVPDAETLNAISQQEAVREIRVQAADWNAYRNKLAGKVAESAPTAGQEGEGRGATGKITAPAEDRAAPPAAGPRDVVKLSRSDGAAAAQGKDATAQEAADARKEDDIARDNAVKEANERVAALEKQIQEMQKLLQLKNQPMADMQEGAASRKPDTVASAKPAAEPAAPPMEAPPAQPESAKNAAATESATPQVAPAEDKPAAEVKQPEPAKKPVPKKPAKPKKPAPPPKPEPGLLDALLENPLVPAGLGGLLIAALGGAWFYRRNKRKQGLDSFEHGILTSGGLRPNTVFGNTAGGTVDTGDVSFMTDFSHGAGAGMIDTSDVDPIAEAEVYMAYGRDVQAEEILKDAIAKEPTRYELHQKLLEIYAGRGDTSAFEALAGELYTTLGADDPHWIKVAEMGHKLEPDNPLYGSASAASHANTTSMQALAGDEPAPAGFVVEEDAGFTPDQTVARTPPNAAEESLLGFDLGAERQAVPGMSVEEEPRVSPAEPPASLFATEPATVKAAGEIAALDFQLDVPAPAGTTPPPAQGMEAPAMPDIGLDFELPAPGTAGSSAGKDGGTTVDFSLPGGMPAAMAETAGGGMDISFELPAMEEPAQAVTAPAPEPLAPEPPATLPAFADTHADLPAMPEVAATTTDERLDVSFDLPLGGAPEIEAAVAAPAMEDMDRTMILRAPVLEDAGTEEIVFEPVAAAPTEGAGEIDISFDLDTFAAPAVTEQPASGLDLDLSGISLDFDETSPAVEVAPEAEVVMPEAKAVPEVEPVMPQIEQAPAQIELPAAPALEVPPKPVELEPAFAVVEPLSMAATSSESPDVETKLDLVTAYLDMGDAEGARELLGEVLNEGGPSQRERAQVLLDSLG